MAISKEFRTLMASKMSTPKVGMGKPSNSEGGEGDLQVRQLSSGRVTIYAKFNNTWHETGGGGGSPSDIVGQTLDTNGYVKFRNGFIIQWGIVVINSTVTFPITFPTACLSVVLGKIGTSNAIPRIESVNANGASFVYSNSHTANEDAYWQAIGH